MRRVGLAMLALLVALIGASALPARAQEDSFLQAIMPLSSVRYNFIYTYNGAPLVVCQAEFASANRSHQTCNELVTLADLDLVAGRVFEVVYYDGTRYQRANESTTWESSPTDFDPQATLNDVLFSYYLYPSDLTATKMGEVKISDTPTTHYQLWSHDSVRNESNGGQFVYDIFVSGPGYVLQDQENVRGESFEFVKIWTYSDFNSPIVVSPPPDSMVQKAASAKGLGFAATALKR
ncbi:MAG: hypothetical protein HGA45_44240 [Chloroflexales bacterium]|nr:hypothetical protein [Chloroflexales bacterium]